MIPIFDFKWVNGREEEKKKKCKLINGKNDRFYS
jgi:hypothetical protein